MATTRLTGPQAGRLLRLATAASVTTASVLIAVKLFAFLLTDSVTLHGDFRDHLFDVDVLGEEKTTHNLEGTVGVTMFF